MPNTDLTNDTDTGIVQQTGLFLWTAENLQTATTAVHGEWYLAKSKNNSDTLKSLTATRIITDTRQIIAGDIFLALVGDNFDGHNFVQVAIDKGAIAAVVSHVNDNMTIPQLKVEDTRLAFGKIAAYRRQQHPNLKVIALTGSSGKTTVKEMLRSIFKQLEVENSKHIESGQKTLNDNDVLGSTSLASTLVTRGNLNNDYGVPMMLLELKDTHRYAVLELGANHVGEIDYVADIVKPDVACVLNVGTAHLGEFGSRDNIAKTKAEIYQSLDKQGIAIIPAQDDYAKQLQQVAEGVTENIIYVGKPVELQDSKKQSTTIAQYLKNTENDSENANAILNNKHSGQVFATNVVAKADSSHFELNFFVTHVKASRNPVLIRTAQIKKDRVDLPVTLPLAGEHNVTNALAAAACAYAIGVTPQTIVKGLSQVASGKGRLYHQQIGQHHLIDDTYNANPDSVRAATNVLAAQTGYKILVLGDIGELGEASKKEHFSLGQVLATKDIDMLLCAGEFAENTIAGAEMAGMTQAFDFESKDALLVKLLSVLHAQEEKAASCTILLKGSRSTSMETLIEPLSEDLQA